MNMKLDYYSNYKFTMNGHHFVIVVVWYHNIGGGVVVILTKLLYFCRPCRLKIFVCWLTIMICLVLYILFTVSPKFG
jgi:hypothetical protein